MHDPTVLESAVEQPLEILDPGSPGVDVALLRTVAARSRRGRAVVLGSPTDAAMVRAEGFQIAARVAVSGGSPRGWSAGLGRTLDRLGPVGAVRTWSEPALVAALGACGDRVRIDASIAAVSARPPALEPWLRRRVAVRAIGEDLGPRLFRRGWRPGPTRSLASLPTAQLPSEPRRRRRRDRDDLVVAVAGCPHDAMDARLVLMAAASAVVAGRAMTVVLSPGRTDWRDLGRWACGMVEASASGRLRLVVDARVEDPRIAGADVDLAVLPVRPQRLGDASLLTARAWLASGVPVVGATTRGLERLVDDGVDGRLLAAGDRNALSRALLRVADDPSLLEDMSHAAAARHGARRPTASGRDRGVQDAGSSPANVSAAVR